MECCGRPNRSDAHLSKEEATKLEGETREYFDGLAPRRHAKPQRSDNSSQCIDAVSNAHDGDSGVIPEYLEFQHLEKDSQKLVYDGSQVPEEFVETEYYKDLGGIDKQHHTTGTGFIKMENTNNVPLSLDSDSTTDLHASCKGNPATNDWIPASSDMGDFISDKLSKSDS